MCYNGLSAPLLTAMNRALSIFVKAVRYSTVWTPYFSQECVVIYFDKKKTKKPLRYSCVCHPTYSKEFVDVFLYN